MWRYLQTHNIQNTEWLLAHQQMHSLTHSILWFLWIWLERRHRWRRWCLLIILLRQNDEIHPLDLLLLDGKAEGRRWNFLVKWDELQFTRFTILLCVIALHVVCWQKQLRNFTFIDITLLSLSLSLSVFYSRNKQINKYMCCCQSNNM
jgi:hypothetical protein